MAGGPYFPIDLHVHTTASDGRLTPEETVTLALQRGLRVLAITDHDSTGGVDRAIAAASGTALDVIPGVEINTDTPKGEVHMLGYFLDHGDVRLQERLADRRRARFDRGFGIVKKLNALGLEISWERVQEIAGAEEGGAVGRPHVARALEERGYVTSTQEAFDKYIGRGGPGYVEYEKLTPEEAIEMILLAGGFAALAHPSTIEGLDGYLRGLMGAGLEGLECYYGQYPEETVLGLVALADRLGLIATGGSDYHGSEQVTYNATLGGTSVPESVVSALRERHRARAG